MAHFAQSLIYRGIFQGCCITLTTLLAGADLERYDPADSPATSARQRRLCAYLSSQEKL